MLRYLSLISLCLCISVAYFNLVSANVVKDKVDPALRKAFLEKEKCDILISFTKGTKEVVEAKRQQKEKFATRGDKIRDLRTALINHGKQQQSAVLEKLNKLKKKQTIEYKSFWISNQIYIKAVGENLVNELAKMGQISRIEEEKIESFGDIKIKAIQEGEIISTGTGGGDGGYHGYYGYGGYCHNFEDSTKIQWGVEKIEAPTVWESGTKGKGIIVGSIDTGARGSHEALQYNFLGKYGWYDPIFFTSEPSDEIGHGTHVIATIAGTKRHVGVAPESEWIMCKACSLETGGCRRSDILECAWYIFCPSDTQGEEFNCDKAPHVVSNSWGSPDGVGEEREWFNDPLWIWRFVGIIPVFSIGNSGPECGTVSSPGDQPLVIGVGNTQKDDTIAPTSSRGPTEDGRIKPDISAPGTDVISAFYTSNCIYATLTGTSMATPHVAGAIALLLSRDPTLEFDDILTAIQSTADSVEPTGEDCGGRLDSDVPNNKAGSGRINVAKALEFLEK